MDGVLPRVGLVAVLVLSNALFAGSELALVSLREGQLQRLEARGGSGAVLAGLARDPNRFLATIQIGITLAGFLASASAAVSLAEPLEEPLDFLGNGARPAAIVVVTLILSYVTLVLGELAPKRIALQRAERWGLFAARPLAVLSKVTRPVVWLLGHSADAAVRIMGGDPKQQRQDVTEEEIRDMVAAQTTFTAQQRTIISGAFEIADRTLDEVMRPRRDVIVLDRDEPTAAAVAKLIASGHSRAPVAEGGDLDHVVGVVHLRELVSDDGATGDGAEKATAADRGRPAMFFPESARVLDVLREMQQARQQLAIVINEHGGADGIITVEDLLEEIVGEIYDETDRDILSVEHDADGTIVLPGRFPLHDLPDIGVDAPDGDYATIAGLILDHLGRIPTQPGDTIVICDWEATVLGIDNRAITKVRLQRRAESSVRAGQTPSER
ncbi:hemolysin family protein [soil metagenome]